MKNVIRKFARDNFNKKGLFKVDKPDLEVLYNLSMNNFEKITKMF